MDKYASDFLDNLIYYRTKRNMSQLELSGICDCAKSTISGIESRKNYPSFELILKIAYALEITPADLFVRNASQSVFETRKVLQDEFMPYVSKFFEEHF
ncbi:MAG: helix-turn-helix transcriptional regulator [Treponema sp.]|nr:helix-turn-helix transcriptional regulator [Treponema sp.]